jgi:hypothetical protein
MSRNNLPVYSYVSKATSNNIGSTFVALVMDVPRKGRIKRARAVITTAHGGAADVYLRIGKAAMTGTPATLDTILEYGVTANPIDGSDLDLYYELSPSADNPRLGALYLATKVDAGTASVVTVALDIEVVA